MKIVFTGAQGVGKTTLLDVMDKCVSFPGKETFKFIRNFTRNLAKLGYYINEQGNSDTQLTIMRALRDISNSTENIIMDRCAIDGYVYTLYLYRKGNISEDTMNECRNVFEDIIHNSNYDYIYYIKPEFPVTGDEYRSDNAQYQQDIANIFEEVISAYKEYLPVINLTGSVSDRLLKIQNTLGGIIKC